MISASPVRRSATDDGEPILSITGINVGRGVELTNNSTSDMLCLEVRLWNTHSGMHSANIAALPV